MGLQGHPCGLIPEPEPQALGNLFLDFIRVAPTLSHLVDRRVAENETPREMQEVGHHPFMIDRSMPWFGETGPLKL